MPLRVDAALSPAESLPTGFAAAVVVDVIRATTTAAYFLQAGVGRLLLAGEVETARRLAEGGALLAGERGGVPLEGFDFGNSPREAAALDLAGREVVMTTTNGTVAALRAAAVSPQVALGALANAGAVARWAAGFNSVLFVAAGREGRLALDDTYAIGVVIEALAGLAEVELSDPARLALEVSRADATEVLAASAAARALEPVGLAADVEVCARRDALRMVPVMKGRLEGALTFEGAVF